MGEEGVCSIRKYHFQLGLLDPDDEPAVGEIVRNLASDIFVELVMVNTFGAGLHDDAADFGGAIGGAVEKPGAVGRGERRSPLPDVDRLGEDPDDAISDHCDLD